MATSGTYAWNLDVIELIEEAYELAGYEARTGQDLITARRSLNLLLADWSTRGINLWALEQLTVDMVSGTTTYSLQTRTLGVIEAVIKKGDVETSIEQIPLEEYHTIPDKTVTGRPSQFAILHARTTPTVYMYPVPNDSTLDFVAWTFRYLQDVTTTYTDEPEVPRRFLPALRLGLAYELALKKPSAVREAELMRVDAERITLLQDLYERALKRAQDMDTEDANLFLRPRRR